MENDAKVNLEGLNHTDKGKLLQGTPIVACLDSIMKQKKKKKEKKEMQEMQENFQRPPLQEAVGDPGAAQRRSLPPAAAGTCRAG